MKKIIRGVFLAAMMSCVLLPLYTSNVYGEDEYNLETAYSIEADEDSGATEFNTVSTFNIVGLKVSEISPTTIKLQWNKTFAADGYIIEQASSGKWNRVGKIMDNGTTSLLVSKLSDDTYYKFRIKAYKHEGSLTTFSPYVVISTRTATKLDRANINHISNTSTGIQVEWTNVSGAAGYYVYRSANGGAYRKIGTVTGNTYVDEKATAMGKKYQYKVVAYKGLNGVIYKSNSSYVKTICRIDTPVISETSNSTVGAYIGWNTTAGATGYSVYKSVDGGAYKFVTNTLETSYIDKSAKTNGIKYKYKIAAYRKVGMVIYKSKSSEIKSITGIGDDSKENNPGFVGFIDWMLKKSDLSKIQKQDLELAREVIDKATNESFLRWYNGENTGFPKERNNMVTVIGDVNDAVNLTNVQKAISVMKDVNDYREKDDNYVGVVKRKPAYTNFYFMAVALTGADRGAGLRNHSLLQVSCENLAFANPEYAVYLWNTEKEEFDRIKKELGINEITSENDIYRIEEEADNQGVVVGHYTNMFWSVDQVMGVGFTNYYSTSCYNATKLSNVLNDQYNRGQHAYKINEFENLLNEYMATFK